VLQLVYSAVKPGHGLGKAKGTPINVVFETKGDRSYQAGNHTLMGTSDGADPPSIFIRGQMTDFPMGLPVAGAKWGPLCLCPVVRGPPLH
jgi:hypothetical protein